MSHGGQCLSAELMSKLHSVYDAVFVNNHENGSLMARMTRVEDELISQKEEYREDIEDIKKGLKDLPKKLLLWLSILIALITLFNFLTPSIQKKLNMTEVAPREVSQHAVIPYTGR